MDFKESVHLTTLLLSPKPAVMRCAGSIITHFAANSKFRAQILTSNVWSTILNLPHVFPIIEEILREFAKYQGAQQQCTDPISGLVHELLNMLRAGPSNFDRWQVGLKGLLALQVF
ncbi:hypothetical protein R3P38DRAFT_68617 [Favolaschia claudopus]|uniref:Huntingtin n=1 Tax=Favolaschia claudopus TaxID=2862362 RepID=A0AAW0D3M3_9AGAR